MILNNGSIWLDDIHPIPVAQSAGMLLIGLPGTGKSITGTLTSMKIMYKFGALLEIADSKRSDLFNLKNYLIKGDKRVAATPDQVARILRIASENMNERYKHFNTKWGWTWIDYHLRPVIIFFDEAGATFSEANSKQRIEIMNYLKQIVYRSRQMGFFVILSSQRLSANVMDRDLTLELGTRIVMGANADADTLRMAFPGVDVKSLPRIQNTPGHGLIYTDLLGTSVPQSIVVDDPSDLNVPELIQYLDLRASQMKFADESSYWKW